MKKILTILISCSLALAASAMAQQDEEQGKPKKEKGQTEKSQQKNEVKPEPKSVHKEHAQTKAPGQENATPKAELSPRAHAVTKGEKEPGNANAPGNEQAGKGKKGRNARTESGTATNATPAGATAESSAPATANPKINKRDAKAEKLNTQGTTPKAQINTQAAQTGAVNTQAGTVGKNGKKADVQAIKAEHASFRAQPRPDKVPAVTFSQGYRINGADQWQGERYAAFRSYHPEMHDQGWYRSNNYRVEVIGGGAYYWNQGYWYPAWGYDPSAQYYAYDAPIYVGSSARPPDQVIADVQSALQQMGYYQGEVDGLLGPQTRQALTEYQTDHQLYATAVIDEPTLDSLGMG